MSGSDYLHHELNLIFHTQLMGFLIPPCYLEVSIGDIQEHLMSGHNNDRAPARQTTRTSYFSGRNNDRAPARQTTRTFFPVVIAIVHPPDRPQELFFRRL